MASAQNYRSEQSLVALQLSDRLILGSIGMGVIFASVGLGEAVYRLTFLDFDGATDRLPIEMLFGLAFAWMILKLVQEADSPRPTGNLRENQFDSDSQLQDSSRGRSDHPGALSEQSASDPGDSWKRRIELSGP